MVCSTVVCGNTLKKQYTEWFEGKGTNFFTVPVLIVLKVDCRTCFLKLDKCKCSYDFLKTAKVWIFWEMYFVENQQKYGLDAAFEIQNVINVHLS